MMEMLILLSGLVGHHIISRAKYQPCTLFGQFCCGFWKLCVITDIDAKFQSLHFKNGVGSASGKDKLSRQKMDFAVYSDQFTSAYNDSCIKDISRILLN